MHHLQEGKIGLNHSRRGQRKGAEAQHLSDALQNTTNTNIPYKEIRSRNNIQWIKIKKRENSKHKQILTEDNQTNQENKQICHTKGVSYQKVCD